MIRRFGEAIPRGQRFRARHGAYAVLADQTSVLLTHQAAPIPEFQLPGGGIDPGESPLRALHREVYEETGWRIGRARRLGAFRRFTYMPEYDLWAEKICHIYLARPVRALGPAPEPGHTSVWMAAPLAIDAVANDGDRHFLEQVFS